MVILGVFAFFIMGLTLGLIGGGGSILTVPILVYIFKQDPLVATANSLFIVGSTAAVGGFQYFLRKEVDIKTALLFSVPSFTGVFLIRKIVLPLIPDTILLGSSLSVSKSLLVMVSFAVIMLFASLKMIRPAKPAATPANAQAAPTAFARLVKVILNGFFIGAVAGFVGAGGGFLIIPALTLLLNLPMRLAVGSSLVIIAIQSLLGFLSSSELTSVDWGFLFTQKGIAVTGIIIGSYLNKSVSEKKLKTGFGYFILVVGLLIIAERLAKSIF